jgi:molecular chaperone HscB
MSPLHKTHFEWFGLPERFEIDLASLDGAWRQVQASVHPDRYASASDVERRLAMQTATQVNEAYRTLRDPCRRAAYLCERAGIDLGIERNTAMPPAFLMEQMEAREALDEAKAARRLDALEGLRKAQSAQRAKLVSQIADAIDARRDFAAAGGLVRQLMFLDKFAVEIDGVEDTLTDG